MCVTPEICFVVGYLTTKHVAEGVLCCVLHTQGALLHLFCCDKGCTAAARPHLTRNNNHRVDVELSPAEQGSFRILPGVMIQEDRAIAPSELQTCTWMKPWALHPCITSGVRTHWWYVYLQSYDLVQAVGWEERNITGLGTACLW